MAFRDVIRRTFGLAPGQFFRSRQKASEVLKTLLFVIPLTFLIWIYAERAQVLDNGKAQVLFNVTVSEPTQTAEVVEGGNTPITLTLSGPRAAVERLKAFFERRSTNQSLSFQLAGSYRAGTEPTIPVVDLINSDPTVQASGVTITEAVPPAVKVKIDRLVTRDVPIRLPADLSRNLQNVVLDPTTVRVRGPESVLATYFSEYSEPVTANLSAYASTLNTPGPHVLEQVPIQLPKDLPKDAVSVSPAAMKSIRFDVSASESDFVIPSVPIATMRLLTLEGRGVVESNTRTITNVRVRGPIESIRKLGGDVPEVRPVAVLRITPENVRAGRGNAAVQVTDLPPNVVVIEQPAPVEFTIRPDGDAN